MNPLSEFAPLMDAVVSYFNKGLILTDHQGKILFHNPEAGALLGIVDLATEKQLHNVDGFELENPLQKIPGQRITNTGQPVVGEQDFDHLVKRGGDDHVVHIHSSVVPVPGFEHPFGVVLIGDITDRHRLNEIASRDLDPGIITRDPTMFEIMDMISRIAPTNASVLLQGESGTGKSLLARMIHQKSTRRENPMVEVNCAAIPESLVESEMFGHVKGAFTGADQNRPGKFQETDGGTLFLDEISELPMHLQPKILKAIEEQRFQMVGSDKTVDVDVRIIAACNEDLRKLVNEGRFRADLYYRLAVIPVEIPSLRDRLVDIPLLAHYICDQLASRGYPDDLECSRETLSLMTDYPWPGNVRELANAVEYGMLFAERGQITPNSLPANIREYYRSGGTNIEVENAEGVDPERKEILDALYKTKWNRGAAARLLGIDRSTLWRRMQRLGLI